MSDNTTNTEATMEKIVSLCKRRGFIYPGSEIYGGLAGTFDYGPLGVMLKKNIQNSWWNHFVTNRTDMYGIDAAILMNPRAWEASGHVSGFSDPLVEDLKTKKRLRADHLVENFISLLKDKNIEYSRFGNAHEPEKTLETLLKISEEQGLSKVEVLNDLIAKYEIKSLDGNNLGKVRQFNMMFKTFVGPTSQEEHEEEQVDIGGNSLDGPMVDGIIPERHLIEYDPSSVVYLRPETAGGMFVNFKNVVDSFHPRLPFGLAQIGKAFRNEIAPRDFIFRLREMEQMEIEYFCNPEEWEKSFEHLRNEFSSWMISIGLPKEKIHEVEIGDGDRAHYSKRTIDFEFDFPMGQKELAGLAYRTNFDLTQHSEFSKTDLSYFDEEKKERFIPHCIEPSIGVERTFLAVLASAYYEEVVGEGDTRTVLKFNPSVAPIQVAVLPLSKKEELSKPAEDIAKKLKKIARVSYDETQSIGKRYRRQDEIGTPYCVTVDFDTLTDNAVTVRDRDTMKQERITIDSLVGYIQEKLGM